VDRWLKRGLGPGTSLHRDPCGGLLSYDNARHHNGSKSEILTQLKAFRAVPRRVGLEASDLIHPNMPANSAQIALERVLVAVGQCLDRQSVESLLRLRADIF
jgi:hypothetical protein